MSSQPTKDKKIFISLDRTLVNSILSALECFAALDERNKYSIHAENLKKTIAKFSFARKGKEDDEDTIVISLYEREAAALINILAVYIFARDGKPDELLDALQQEYHKKGSGNFPAAEQTKPQ